VIVDIHNDSDTTDYLVVGAGTAGCVVASRLSEDPDVRVVLLEAGAADGPEAMSVPSTWPMLVGTSVDWAYTTEPQTALTGRDLNYPRGRVLGGTSSINGMVHLRGHRANYDGWSAAGATGWGYDDLLPYFCRSEHAVGRDARYRGTGGPMIVTGAEEVGPFENAAFDAMAELGLPISDDLNGADQEGAGWIEQNIVDGHRQSAADAYIRPALEDRPNLTVMTGAVVRRLVISGGRCRGVEYILDGAPRRIEATREVVLCAGAIGSPHLMMVSGIGPADDLRRHGVDVVAHLPGVGRNLQDHPMARVVRSSAGPVASGADVHRPLGALLRTTRTLDAPDVQIFFFDRPFYPATGPIDGYAVAVVAARPHSRGTVTLASADPAVAPRIDPGLLTADRDVAVLLAGLQIAREIAGTRALADWSEEELRPGPGIQDQPRLREFLREFAHSAFHPAGTCRIGDDDHGVVDTELRVRGITHLRVADASVMPDLVGANPNATVLAIGERAAAMIRDRRAVTGCRSHHRPR
jgi:choline dehydrogenase